MEVRFHRIVDEVHHKHCRMLSKTGVTPNTLVISNTAFIDILGNPKCNPYIEMNFTVGNYEQKFMGLNVVTVDGSNVIKVAYIHED